MREPRWVPYAAVAILAAAVYVHTLAFGFVFDDVWLVVQNQFLREPWSAVRAFGHHFWHGTPFGTGYYRPIVTASFALNGRLLGWGPAGFHLFNVLLHAANSCLLLLLLRRLRLSWFASGVAACLFAVHPAAAWPVGSIVARVDLLPAFFVLLAWNAWVGPSTSGAPGAPEEEPPAGPPPVRRSWPGALLTGAAFLGALFCKESSVAFLGILMMAALRPARSDRPSARWLPVIAAAAALTVYFAARWANGIGYPAINEQVNPLSELSWPSRFIAALEISGRYLLYLVLPVRFHDPHAYGPTAPPPGVTLEVVLSGLLLMTLIAIVTALWWRRDRLALPAAFALGSFLPASNLLLPIASLYAQNFLYLPLIGVCLVAGEVIHRVVRAPAFGPGDKVPVRAWVAGSIVVALGLAAAREATIWRDYESLFRAWTRRFPNYALAHGHLGLALLDGGRAQESIRSLRRSLALDDRSVETQANLGVALLRTRSDREGLEEALAHCRAAIKPDSDFVNPRVNASNILLLLGRPGEAEAEAREAVRIAPDLYAARVNLAEALFRQKKYSDAAAEFERLVAANPGEVNVRSPYVVSLLHTDDLDAARRAALQARRDFPDLAWFDFCLARVQARSGHRAEAMTLLELSLSKDEATRGWLKEVDDFAPFRKDRGFAAILGKD